MLAAISLVFIIVSICTFVVVTHPYFRVPLNESDPILDTWTAYDIMSRSEPHISLKILNVICTHYFTFEFVARLYFAPNRRALLHSALTWIDLLSGLPFYIDFVIYLFAPQWSRTAVWLRLFSILRIFRVFRLFRLTRQWTGLKVTHLPQIGASRIFEKYLSRTNPDSTNYCHIIFLALALYVAFIRASSLILSLLSANVVTIFII